MQNFIVTFNIVAPFMLYMLFGALLKRVGIMTPDFTERLNKLVSGAVLPIFNFYNFIQADLSALRQGGYVLYILAGTAVVLIIMLAVTGLLRRSPGRSGAMIDTVFVNNTMVFGCAIALSMYGEGNIAPMILVAAVLLPVYNAMIIPVIQLHGSKQAALESVDSNVQGVSISKMLKDIITNPLVIAVICGLICCLIKVQFPLFINTFLSNVSATLTPLIFIIMGARFTLEGFKSDAKDLTITLLLKLVLLPLIAVILPIKMGYRDIVLLSVLLAFGSPSGVTTVPVCKSCGCDDRFAGEMVATSSGLSILTVFLWIFIFKQFGLL